MGKNKFKFIPYSKMESKCSYSWVGMRPVSYEEACSLFGSEQVFILHDDGAESEVVNIGELEEGEIYGVELGWEKYNEIRNIIDEKFKEYGGY